MKTWIGIGVFFVVLVVAFALFAIHIAKSPAPQAAPAPTTAAITNVRVKDTYSGKSGVHSIQGKATVPTACTTLTASSTVITEGEASTTPVIRIELSAPIDTGMCLELPTDVSFSFSPHAPSGATIEVLANGVVASTTAL